MTLGSRPITGWTRLNGKLATGSDQKGLEWELSVDKQEVADHVRVIGWNVASMSKYDEEGAEKLWKELEGQRAHLDE